MPYLAQFGLREHPFALTPNTQQYFPTATHGQILQSLEYAIRRNSGIMKVVGDVGMGKTLLCRLLLKDLEGKAEVAYLNAPQAEGDSLIALVCHEFGLPRGDRADMLGALNAFLLGKHEEGRDCVLVVDEAQALGPEGLETIRLLSNIETERAKLLQIILFGQTELDDLLSRPNLRQINQRIGFSFSTGPFSPVEAASYIKHRLSTTRVDGVDWAVFEPKAIDLVVKASSGIPRVINILSDKALLIAYAEGGRSVGARHIRAAIADSPALVRAVVPATSRPSRWLIAAMAAALIVGAGIAAAVVGGDHIAAAAKRLLAGLAVEISESTQSPVPVEQTVPEVPAGVLESAAPREQSESAPVAAPPASSTAATSELELEPVVMNAAPEARTATADEQAPAQQAGDGRQTWN